MRTSFLLIAAALLSCALAATVQAQPRARIVLFEDADFSGEQRVVDGEVRDFRAIGFNDRVSSIQIGSGTWEFCEDADFRGGCITLSRDDRNLQSDGFNDRISSARPVADRGNAGRDTAGGGSDQRGSGVILFQDVGYGGDSRQVSDTVADFRSLRFNDATSSIRILSGTWLFCSDANFQGRCMTFDKDVQSLVSINFNDTISSMRRVR
jgi:hypothetical protein